MAPLTAPTALVQPALDASSSRSVAVDDAAPALGANASFVASQSSLGAGGQIRHDPGYEKTEFMSSEFARYPGSGMCTGPFLSFAHSFAPDMSAAPDSGLGASSSLLLLDPGNLSPLARGARRFS